MLFNYPPRIVKALNGAGIYTDEQVLLNLNRLGRAWLAIDRRAPCAGESCFGHCGSG